MDNPAPAGEEVVKPIWQKCSVCRYAFNAVTREQKCPHDELLPASPPPSARPAEQCSKYCVLPKGHEGWCQRVATAPKSSTLGEEMKHDISPEEAAGIAHGLADMKAGRVRPLADIERELGISSGAKVDCGDVRAMGAENANTGNRKVISSAQSEQSAAASDAGQPVTVTLRTNLTEPFDKLVDHLQDCCGGCPYCVELCEQVVKEAYEIQQKRAAPSAPASAAREVAHTICKMFDTQTWELRFTQLEGEIEELLDTHIGEQTRQLREELARERAISVKCWHTYEKALNDAGVPNQVVASTEDETFTSKGIRWLAKERDEYRQRAQAAEAQLMKEREHRQALLRKELASASVSNSIEDANEIARLQAELLAAEAERDKLLEGDVQRVKDISRLAQERDTALGEVERLRTYAEHKHLCNFIINGRCTCGLLPNESAEERLRKEAK